MRLIDADKIVYSWQQDRNGKFHDGVTLESIINSIPTQNVNDLITKELEKIKTEIEKHCGLIEENHCKYCSYCHSVIGVREIIEIIDKYNKEGEEPKGDDKPLN